MGYVLIVVLSVAVGVVVYRASGRVPIPEDGPEAWSGAASPHARRPRIPTNFERLSISRVQRSWHDRVIGALGLVVAVAVGAGALTAALYLLGRAAIALLEKAAAPTT